MNLWPHQVQAIDQTLDWQSQGVRRILLTTPTGGGKTVVAEELIEAWTRQGLKTILFTNRTMLLEQTSRALSAAGIDHGIRAAGYSDDTPWPVQLAMIQTEESKVYKRKEWAPFAWDRCLIDEAHVNRAGVMQKILAEGNERGGMYVGLTATPLGLMELYDRLLVAGTLSSLRQCGALVPCRHFACDEPDMRGVKARPGEDLTENQARKAIMRNGIGGRVLDWFNKLNPERRPSILFAPGVAESLWFAEQFVAAGISAAHIDGENIWTNGELHRNTEKLRRQLLEGSRDGSITVLCNRFVLREGIDCLDSETEILTASGWKGIGQVQAGDVVYSLNRDTEKMEYDCVQRCLERCVDAGEKMLTIKSQHVDIRTTEGHEFHIKYTEPRKGRSSSWLTKTGRELSKRKSDYHLPISAVSASEGAAPLSHDELKLVAWFMTDGGFVDNDRLVITQSKDYHHEIRNLLVRLDLDFRERERVFKTGYPNAKTCHEFTIPKGTHGGKLARRGWAPYAAYLDKKGSPLLRGMSRWQFYCFWQELLKGDGSNFDGNKSGYLACNLKSQADLYMELAVTRGFATSCYQHVTKNGVTMYLVRCRDSQWIGSRPSDTRAAKMELLPAIPGERVWCITNGNGTIVTRRQGKVAILGNCPWLSHGIFATVFGSLSTYLQSGGRLLRAYPGLESVTIQDHGGHWHRLGSLNADRDWKLFYTNAIAAGLREDRLRNKKCTACGEGLQGLPNCPHCGTCNEVEPTRCPKCGQVLNRPRCPCGYEVNPTLKSRPVVQSDGTLREMKGDIYKPHRICKRPDGPKIWERLYYRSKTVKGARTFRAAEAMFAMENNWGYPNRTWPLMPTNELDFFRLVAEVPFETLIQKG